MPLSSIPLLFDLFEPFHLDLLLPSDLEEKMLLQKSSKDLKNKIDIKQKKSIKKRSLAQTKWTFFQPTGEKNEDIVLRNRTHLMLQGNKAINKSRKIVSALLWAWICDIQVELTPTSPFWGLFFCYFLESKVKRT